MSNKTNVRNHTKSFKFTEDVALHKTIDVCFTEFMDLNDVCLRHLDENLSSIEGVQKYLYEAACEAACCISSSRYHVDKDLRLLRMQQIIKKF